MAFTFQVFCEEIFKKRLRYAEVRRRKSCERRAQIQESAQGGSSEHTQGSRVRNAAPVGSRPACRVVNEQERMSLFLRQKDGCTFTGVELQQSRAGLTTANGPDLQPLGL